MYCDQQLSTVRSPPCEPPEKSNLQLNCQKYIFYRVIFLTGSALKVLSVGDGKIPTKKGKFELKNL